MLTIDKMNSKEYFLNFYNSDFVKSRILSLFNKDITSEEIFNSPKLLNRFYLNIITSVHESQKRNENIENYAFFDKIPFETIKNILFYSSVYSNYVDRDFERFIYSKYPELQIINALSMSAWQVFDDHLNESNLNNFYDKMTSLKNPLDERFSIYPTFTTGCPRGYNEGSWFKKLAGKKDSKPDQEGQIHGHSKFWLDSKLGFVIYFKNKPSIIVSFQVLNDTIFINQIQSVKKDRGHYKIKGNWREFIVNYITEHFEVPNVNLVSAYTAKKVVCAFHAKGTITVSSILNSCINSYNKPFPNSTKRIRVRTREGLFTYRPISSNKTV